ncbi:Hypothetical protein A7982_00595 [Minicystis rosea]|nr:Hypothetical protein A7982_00595 [Minicystis rosea]
MPHSPEALQTWIAAVREAYVSAGDWRCWAEHAIRAVDQAPSWLLELHEAERAKEALHALERGLETLGVVQRDPIVSASLRIGFAWLLHEREVLDLAEALERGIAVIDAGQHAGMPDRAAFHGLLLETDGGGPAIPERLSLNARAALLFAPHAELARARLQHL